MDQQPQAAAEQDAMARRLEELRAAIAERERALRERLRRARSRGNRARHALVRTADDLEQWRSRLAEGAPAVADYENVAAAAEAEQNAATAEFVAGKLPAIGMRLDDAQKVVVRKVEQGLAVAKDRLQAMVVRQQALDDGLDRFLDGVLRIGTSEDPFIVPARAAVPAARPRAGGLWSWLRRLFARREPAPPANGD